jgi:hypothetical protein
MTLADAGMDKAAAVTKAVTMLKNGEIARLVQERINARRAAWGLIQEALNRPKKFKAKNVTRLYR